MAFIAIFFAMKSLDYQNTLKGSDGYNYVSDPNGEYTIPGRVGKFRRV
jgi:hypothetical protein